MKLYKDSYNKWWLGTTFINFKVYAIFSADKTSVTIYSTPQISEINKLFSGAVSDLTTEAGASYVNYDGLMSACSDFFDYAPGSGASIQTPEGGFFIYMVNGTGAPTVKGTLVSASPTEDKKFVLQANEYDAMGVVYESGIANGALCKVVVSGWADILLKDGTASTRGYVILSADTDGRAITIAVPSSNPVTAEHFKEVGHCFESKTAGTNVLFRGCLHFN